MNGAWTALLGVAATALVGTACRRAEGPREVLLTSADTLLTMASGHVGRAVDLAVDDSGAVYVLDLMLKRVLVVPPDGSAPWQIGRDGQGPGELNGPLALMVAGDTVHVADLGNARIQMFTRDGREAGSRRVPDVALGSGLAMSRSGRLAFPARVPEEQELARVLNPDGRPEALLGQRLGKADEVVDFEAIKRQIASGVIPDELRNNVRPVLSGDSSIWLLMLAEPAVRHFDLDGREHWYRSLEAPEIEAIRAHFFERNRQLRSPSTFFNLAYIADAVDVDGSLWLLLATGDEAPSVVFVVHPAGSVAYRVVAPGIVSPKQLAVDTRRAKLYLALASTELVALSLPTALLARDR